MVHDVSKLFINEFKNIREQLTGVVWRERERAGSDDKIACSLTSIPFWEPQN